MFRRPGIQTQTFKYVESSFGMRNSNLGERNVIVVSATSTGEDPNTYPIVPKGKNLKKKKKLCMNQSQCRYAPLTITIYVYRSFYINTEKHGKKVTHFLEGGTAINTPKTHRPQVWEEWCHPELWRTKLKPTILDYFTTFSHPTPPPQCKKEDLGASTQDLQMKSSPPQIMPLYACKIDILIPGI